MGRPAATPLNALCPLCLAYRWTNKDDRQAHNREQHGARPGWMNLGRKVKRGKHLRPSREQKA